MPQDYNRKDVATIGVEMALPVCRGNGRPLAYGVASADSVRGCGDAVAVTK